MLGVFFMLCGVAGARTMVPEDLYGIASFADPAFSPDKTKVAFVERRIDVKSDKRRGTLELIELASDAQRALTFEREGVASPQWSPDGTALAFLANDNQHHGQVFVMSLRGGDPTRITATHDGVQQYAWRPDGAAIAYVTADATPDKAAVEKHHDFFDIGDDDYLARAYTPPSHLWIVSRAGANAHRLTSGTWSAATSYPPSPPASPLSWSPDGKSLLFSRVPNTRDGDAYRSEIVRLDVASGSVTPLTGRDAFEGFANYSPDGTKMAYLYSRGGDPNNVNDVFLSDAAGGPGVDISAKLDRAIFRAQWFPDGKSLLVGAHEGARVALWRLHLDGSYERIETGDVDPSWFFWIDAAIGSDGSLAFPGSLPHHPSELWYLAAGGGAPKMLTDANANVAALELGRVETIAWENDGFKEDGVLLYPPHFTPGKRYPLVLTCTAARRPHRESRSMRGPRFWPRAGGSSSSPTIAAATMRERIRARDLHGCGRGSRPRCDGGCCRHRETRHRRFLAHGGRWLELRRLYDVLAHVPLPRLADRDLRRRGERLARHVRPRRRQRANRFRV